MQTEPIEAIPAGHGAPGRAGRGWAGAGVLAGVAGFAGMEVESRLAPENPAVHVDAGLVVDGYVLHGRG
jgi:hypothetical protein